jgi:ATP-dependent RNA helicase RhlE
VLVFTRMKHGANRLCEHLVKAGITAMAIHGNKSQGARTKALAEFKTGELCVLVATDIAARGIDIDQLPHVINYELPNVPEDYVHRIGRTGRAGAQGEALSLVCLDEETFLADIEKLIKRSIPREAIAGFEADPGERAEPIQIGRRTLGGGGGAGNGRGAGGGGGGRGGDQRRPSAPAGQPRGNAPARPGSAPQRPAQAAPRGGRPQGAGGNAGGGNGGGAKRPALTSGRRSG